MKGYGLEINVLAISLYYRFICVKVLDKSKLELLRKFFAYLVATAVFLSQKFCGPHSLTILEAVELANGTFEQREMIEMEFQLLEIMGLDLIVETTFEYVC